MISPVTASVDDETSEGVNGCQSILWVQHQDWEEYFSDGEKIVIGGFTIDGRECIARLFEEECDCLGLHF